jgi:hypothetical protein
MKIYVIITKLHKFFKMLFGWVDGWIGGWVDEGKRGAGFVKYKILYRVKDSIARNGWMGGRGVGLFPPSI